MIFRWRRAPAWSAFDDRSEHDALVELVLGQLREADLSVVEQDGGRVLAVGGGATIDLGAVTEATVDLPPAAWQDEVRNRIASATNPNRPPTDPARLLPAVRVRLMTATAHERFPKRLPHRRHADLVEVLVIDAGGLVWAGEGDLAPLGLALDELFALGRENVREHEPVRTSDLDVDGLTVTLVGGDHDYVASWALLLDDLLDVPSEDALVAAPTARTLLVHATAGATEADTAPVRAAAADRHEAGPKRLSPRLYRWRDGDLTPTD